MSDFKADAISLVSRITGISRGGVKLQRNLTVWGGISLVIGTMIGSGIFVSPTGIIKYSGQRSTA